MNSDTATSSRLRRRGILFVVSAPSGAGKSTLLDFLKSTPDFAYSISCTTRAPRPGEVDGRDYFFLTREEFERRIAAGAFLEHALVHGNYYGTPRDYVLRHLEAGEDVLMDLDIQGARQVRAGGAEIDASLVDVFMLPPSHEELRRRLLRRGTETPEQLEVRLRNAAVETQAWREYRYAFVSGAKEDDFANFRAIMIAERMIVARLSME